MIWDTEKYPNFSASASPSIVISSWLDDSKLKAKNDEGKVSGGRLGKRTTGNTSHGAKVGLIILTKGNEIRLAPGAILRIRFERPAPLPSE